jgi:hypothetical protein
VLSFDCGDARSSSSENTEVPGLRQLNDMKQLQWVTLLSTEIQEWASLGDIYTSKVGGTITGFFMTAPLI